MADARVRIDLYCEDHGHELFVTALIRRLAREERVTVDLKTRSGRGGHGRAVTELKAWLFVDDLRKAIRALATAGS